MKLLGYTNRFKLIWALIFQPKEVEKAQFFSDRKIQTETSCRLEKDFEEKLQMISRDISPKGLVASRGVNRIPVLHMPSVSNISPYTAHEHIVKGYEVERFIYSFCKPDIGLEAMQKRVALALSEKIIELGLVEGRLTQDPKMLEFSINVFGHGQNN